MGRTELQVNTATRETEQSLFGEHQGNLAKAERTRNRQQIECVDWG